MCDFSPTLSAGRDHSIAATQAAFLTMLPVLECQARIRFRHVRCPQSREDARAEVVALAWRWFRRLVERGKDPARFVRRIARFACAHVRAGRRLCGQEGTKDVLSPCARACRGFAVLPWPPPDSPRGTEFDEALQFNTQTEIPEQVSFRLDFPRWRKSHSARNRHVIDALMRGEPAGVVAARLGISAGRVSQLRRELRDDWSSFRAEPTTVAVTHVR